ncbi:MAG: ABATE domain-containing protein [Pseudomonadota bacterium]
MEATAYSHLVDGLELPVPLAGHPALELCNTRAGWGEAAPKEYLASYAHLVALAREVGLVSPEDAAALDAPSPAALRRALALREALYQVVSDPRPGDAWSVVADEAARAAAVATLTPEGWRLPVRADLPVLAVARSAAELLTSEHAPVRRCPGTGCGWLFLDPRGRRRWCTMATCGNRAKVRAHAARARERARAR